MDVIAIKNFEHNGKRVRGDVFEVSPVAAMRLKSRGLVRAAADAPSFPSQAAGQKPSALPVEQVSEQTTAKKSKRGKTPELEEESSAPTLPLG